MANEQLAHPPYRLDLRRRACGCSRRPPSPRALARKTITYAYWAGIGGVHGITAIHPDTTGWLEGLADKAPCCPAGLTAYDSDADRRPAGA